MATNGALICMDSNLICETSVHHTHGEMCSSKCFCHRANALAKAQGEVRSTMDVKHVNDNLPEWTGEKEVVMQSELFNKVIEASIDRSMSVLVKKNASYAGEDVDRLAGVKHSADILKTTNKKAIAGMMSKHTSSIYGMLDSGEFFDRDIWNEKISDHINYLLLLEAVIHEEQM